MKKYIFFLVSLIICISTKAQLKSNMGGRVTISCDSNWIYSKLTIGDVPALMLPAFKDGTRKTSLASYTYPNKIYNYGVVGSCSQSVASYSGRSYGVYGMAGNCYEGYNYGLFGYLNGTASGAAVYGTISSPNGTNIYGQYAAYFQGDAVITGTATINDIVTQSDIRLKENIENLECEDIHSRLMDVNVISYKLKDTNNSEPDNSFPKGNTAEKDRRTKYGVSAQEIQELFPDLVVEGQDGYLAVNYMELVPMLICSVQQLQKELDELRGKEGERKVSEQNRREMPMSNKSLFGGCALYRNTPNPARTQTSIGYKIPSTASDAQMLVLNLQGTLVKKTPLSPLLDSVTISLDGLSEGVYLYSLVVSGKEIDTKRMVVTK